MAGPITHTVLAIKIIDSLSDDQQKRQFIAGNLFPDIRYLNVIDRESTHFSGVTLDDITKESDAFRAGVLYHSYVDIEREAIVTRSGVYKSLPDSRFTAMALKIVEDVKMYNDLDKWPLYASYLEDVQRQEKSYKIPQEAIIQWHSINAHLFIDPSVGNYRTMLKLIGLDGSQVEALFSIVDTIIERKLVEVYIDQLKNIDR